MALIEGCELASSPWIARQDADDLSLPGRLRAQMDRALQPDAPVLITCGTMWRTPDDFDLFESLSPDDSDQLRSRILDEGQSICAHGTAFFSKEVYRAVGGYRSEFYYAQDLDLFTRLAKAGSVASVPEVFYRYTFSPHSISTHSSAVQEQFRRLILRSDESALREAKELSMQVREGRIRKADPFSGYYFIGCCLRKKDPAAAAEYFHKALGLRPWSIRARFRSFQTGGVR